MVQLVKTMKEFRMIILKEVYFSSNCHYVVELIFNTEKDQKLVLVDRCLSHKLHWNEKKDSESSL